mgnify:CR=1 FL=1
MPGTLDDEPAVSEDDKLAMLRVLSNPETFKLESNTWFTLDPTEEFSAKHAAHCLPTLLAPLLSRQAFHQVLTELRIIGPTSHRATALESLFATYRDPELPDLIIAKGATSGRTKVRCIAYGAREPPVSVDEQLAASTRGLRAIQMTQQALLAHRPQTRSAQPPAAAAQREAELRAALPPPPAPPPSAPRLSLGAIITALGVPKPHLDSSGNALSPALLNRTFATGLEQMSVSSSGRRELLRAAAAATFHVLNALAPEPLVTAAALAERPKRTKQADPMRLTLSEPKAVGKPQLLDLIAKSELARELVYSYVCAAQRKEPWAVKAQILSPFTAQYSLRLFNESFEPQLRECGPVKRYGWWFAKWHGAIWLAGQSAAKSSTQRWRLKGAGDLATLPHAKIVLAVEFLCSPELLQHVAFGTRRVKTSTGWVEFSDTQRTQCAAALWKLYKASPMHLSGPKSPAHTSLSSQAWSPAQPRSRTVRSTPMPSRMGASKRSACATTAMSCMGYLARSCSRHQYSI